MSRAIVSAATDGWSEITRITWPAMGRYASSHGAVFCGSALDGRALRPSPWGKLAVIAGALSDYDEVLWLDADVLIVDHSKSIFGEFEQQAETAMAMHPNPEHWNTGVWLLRRPMIRALVLAGMRDEFIQHPWWEQAAVHAVIADEKIRVQAIGLEWNSCPVAMHESPRFLHACGLHGDGQQLRQIREWAS